MEILIVKLNFGRGGKVHNAPLPQQEQWSRLPVPVADGTAGSCPGIDNCRAL